MNISKGCRNYVQSFNNCDAHHKNITFNKKRKKFLNKKKINRNNLNKEENVYERGAKIRYNLNLSQIFNIWGVLGFSCIGNFPVLFVSVRILSIRRPR